MGDRIAALAGLRPEERKRLEQFALAFERLDASSYPLFTEQVVSEDVFAAQQEALKVIGSGGRKSAVRAAIDAFVDAGSRAYSGRMSLTDTFLLYQSLPDRAEDRVKFLTTVERAVVGLILWDELEPDDRAALLGPWSAFIELPDESATERPATGN
jgi:hypothetical protein